MPQDNTFLLVILGVLLVLYIFYMFRRRSSQDTYIEPVEMYEMPTRKTNTSLPADTSSAMRKMPPPNVERVETVLGRLEDTFHLKGIPQSINIPEMAVGFGVGPGILGNMRNPSENIYLGPNTGIF